MIFLSDSSSHSGLVTLSPAQQTILVLDSARQMRQLKRYPFENRYRGCKPYGIILLCIPLDTVHIFTERPAPFHNLLEVQKQSCVGTVSATGHVHLAQ